MINFTFDLGSLASWFAVITNAVIAIAAVYGISNYRKQLKYSKIDTILTEVYVLLKEIESTFIHATTRPHSLVGHKNLIPHEEMLLQDLSSIRKSIQLIKSIEKLAYQYARIVDNSLLEAIKSLKLKVDHINETMETLSKYASMEYDIKPNASKIDELIEEAYGQRPEYNFIISHKLYHIQEHLDEIEKICLAK